MAPIYPALLWRGAAVALLCACTDRASPQAHPAGAGAGPRLIDVVVTPEATMTHPGNSVRYEALGQFSDGSVDSVDVVWMAGGGSITGEGWYTAGDTLGSYHVIANHAATGRADTAGVTVMAPSPQGQYETLAAADWKSFPDKDALAGLFGVEGNLHAQPPALPVTAFYDLVPDPLFGKVIRYNGGPHLNTAASTTPGRIAVHGASFPPVNNVWVRQYLRFDPQWTTGGSNPPGGTSYKVMFIRWEAAPFRQGFLINGTREIVMEWGQGVSTAVNTKLPWDNHAPLCSRDGLGGADAVDLVKVTAVCSNNQGRAGTGEWFEIVMHVTQSGTYSARAALALRRYTANGGRVVQPGAWTIIAREISHPPMRGNEIKRARRYEMGVNRNKQWDEVMNLYWGPYEVVDGNKYPNPWGMPWP